MALTSGRISSSTILEAFFAKKQVFPLNIILKCSQNHKKKKKNPQQSISWEEIESCEELDYGKSEVRVF